MNAQAHIAHVAADYGLTKDDLIGPSKSHRFATARKELFFRLVIVRGLTLTQAGNITRKDHTTVLYGLRKFAAQMFGTRPKASLEEIRTAALDERKAA